MKAFATLILGAFSYAVGAFAVATAILATQHWFGAGDLRAFGFWTALTSVAVALLAVGQASVFARLPHPFAIPLAAVVGSLLGYGSTLLVWKALGPWFGAFTFSVFYCWVFGGAIACIVATLFARKKNA